MRKLSLSLLVILFLTLLQITFVNAANTSTKRAIFNYHAVGSGCVLWGSLITSGAEPPEYIAHTKGFIHSFGSAEVEEWECPPDSDYCPPFDYVSVEGTVDWKGFVVVKWTHDEIDYKLWAYFYSTETTMMFFFLKEDLIAFGSPLPPPTDGGSEPPSWRFALKFEGALFEDGVKREISGYAISLLVKGMPPNPEIAWLGVILFIDLGEDKTGWDRGFILSVYWFDKPFNLENVWEGWPEFTVNEARVFKFNIKII